jgi:hypothetical protein
LHKPEKTRADARVFLLHIKEGAQGDLFTGWEGRAILPGPHLLIRQKKSRQYSAWTGKFAGTFFHCFDFIALL